MKKILILAAVVGFAVALVPADNAQAAVGTKVAICHFDDHVGDFVTTGKGNGCERQGGNVILVSQKACERGHNAGGDCGADNIYLLDPDVLRGNG